MILLGTLAYLYLFWLCYIGVMGVYRAYLDGRLSNTLIVLLIPFVLFGVALDVFANIFIASIVFWEPPREWLVTQRLTRYMKTELGPRKRIAEFVCTNMLDIFDPTGKHCQ